MEFFKHRKMFGLALAILCPAGIAFFAAKPTKGYGGETGYCSYELVGNFQLQQPPNPSLPEPFAPSWQCISCDDPDISDDQIGCRVVVNIYSSDGIWRSQYWKNENCDVACYSATDPSWGEIGPD